MDIYSQSSVASSVSTIPLDIVASQDEEFIEEIEKVNDLYFGNVELCPESENEHFGGQNVETDSESDGDADVNENDTDHVSSGLPDEFRELDISEQQTLAIFQDKTCGCVRLYGKPCSSVVDWQGLIDYRSHCQEVSRSELDVMVKIQLFHHRKSGNLTDSKKHKSKERQKHRQEYYFGGHQICRDTFAFAHGISRKKVDAIARTIETDGLVPRTYGNKGKSPKHALSMSDVQHIKMFLVSYGNKFGLPLPGRLPNCRDSRAVLLPSDKTKADIHQEYLKAAIDMDLRQVCLSEFKAIWLEQSPHILLMKPATDLCYKCQMFSTTLAKCGNLTEEEKAEKLSDYQAYLGKAKMQRDHYREQSEQARAVFTSLTPEERQRGRQPCSLSDVQHYSFDYAQQIHYPHYAQQVGPLFFKTPRKCQCFGVCAEGSGSQVFYLVDEAQHSWKGANTVTSLLHHHFQYRGYGETDVRLHMDNCTGQNKNNIVIGYGLWRTLTGKHHTLEFSLMEAGHTKFHQDWHFGLWKVKWRSTSAETLEEVAASVRSSSRNNHNIPQLVDDAEAPVEFWDWKSFFKQFFKPLPNLTSYHHFRMDRDHPGVVFVRRYASDEETAINVMKTATQRSPLSPSLMPEKIPCAGLDPQRQWYLYEQVAPFCFNTTACPQPRCPKPAAVKTDCPEKCAKQLKT